MGACGVLRRQQPGQAGCLPLATQNDCGIDRRRRPVPKRQHSLDLALVLDKNRQDARHVHVADHMGAGFLARAPDVAQAEQWSPCASGTRGIGMCEARAAGAGASGATGAHGNGSMIC